MTRAKKRARRDWGRIRRLPSGRFQASYDHPVTHDLVRAPRTFADCQYAEEWLAERHSALFGVTPDPVNIRREHRAESFVYFIQAGHDGPIKIGISTNVPARLASLQTSVPYKLRLLVTIPGDVCIERQLHREHALDRLEGEWFRPTGAILRRVDELIHGMEAW